MIRCIIAGPRDYFDYTTAESYLDKIFSVNKPDVIISGTASGMDEIGEMWAVKNSIRIERFPANWLVYGPSAGPRRNEEMAKNATHCVVIWQGKSKGSKNMIETARRYKLTLREVLVT